MLATCDKFPRAYRNVSIAVGRRKLGNALSEPYSLMHTLFDEIYILSFSHEPHKWIQCKQRMKAVGISGTRLTMSREDELETYRSWLGGSSGSSMSVEQWCISKQIVRLLKQLAAKKGRVCFFSADVVFHPKFETILYNSLLTAGEEPPELITFSPRQVQAKVEVKAKAKEFIGMGIGSEFYKVIVAKFESAPVPIDNLCASEAEVGAAHAIDCLSGKASKDEVFLSRKYYLTILSTRRGDYSSCR